MPFLESVNPYFITDNSVILFLVTLLKKKCNKYIIKPLPILLQNYILKIYFKKWWRGEGVAAFPQVYKKRNPRAFARG